jgi:hypothetical protein
VLELLAGPVEVSSDAGGAGSLPQPSTKASTRSRRMGVT